MSHLLALRQHICDCFGTLSAEAVIGQIQGNHSAIEQGRTLAKNKQSVVFWNLPALWEHGYNELCIMRGHTLFAEIQLCLCCINRHICDEVSPRVVC